MSVSDVDICNMALSEIGAKGEISALSEKTKEATTCSLFYENARKLLLSSFQWNFANAYISVADTGEAVGNWTYSYKYPGDCLKLVKINPEVDENLQFEIAHVNNSRLILSDQETPTLKYIVDVKSPVQYSATFVHLFTLFLARRLVMPITRDSRRIAAVQGDLSAAMVAARAASANEEVNNFDQAVPSWFTDR